MSKTFEQFWEQSNLEIQSARLTPKEVAEQAWDAAITASQDTLKQDDVCLFFLRRGGKKLAVIGSREIGDEKKRGARAEFDKTRIAEVLNKNKDQIKLIISGGARGADTLGVEWAAQNGIPYLVFPALWHDPATGLLDKGAGFRRNFDIVKNADVVLAFMKKGGSPGTKHSLQVAQDLKRKTKVIELDDSALDTL